MVDLENVKDFAVVLVGHFYRFISFKDLTEGVMLRRKQAMRRRMRRVFLTLLATKVVLAFVSLIFLSTIWAPYLFDHFLRDKTSSDAASAKILDFLKQMVALLYPVIVGFVKIFAFRRLGDLEPDTTWFHQYGQPFVGLWNLDRV
ncbi:hypothetical protein K440DRAFT_659229 [Wilcoxina mikolae CBS 423.85]|nr:hypothetical protein K440DRAFT_659229 [Wilcoxina mikolae CBS 423.85]